jgi:uncharacterized membrane protein YphA (DoxX/SURF4 family)
LVLGFTFVVAAIEKISYPEEFAVAIQAYQLIPLQWINIVALILPWLELVCGVLLLVGARSRSSAIVVSFLLLVFLGGITWALYHHLNIDCGCFGTSHSSPVGIPKILEDVGLLILAIQLWTFPESAFSVE